MSVSVCACRCDPEGAVPVLLCTAALGELSANQCYTLRGLTLSFYLLGGSGMAGSNWKEHSVVIANCSGECCALPLEVHPWVGFVPDFRVVAHGVHDYFGFHSLCNIPKQSWI